MKQTHTFGVRTRAWDHDETLILTERRETVNLATIVGGLGRGLFPRGTLPRGADETKGASGPPSRKHPPSFRRRLGGQSDFGRGEMAGDEAAGRGLHELGLFLLAAALREGAAGAEAAAGRNLAR